MSVNGPKWSVEEYEALLEYALENFKKGKVDWSNWNGPRDVKKAIDRYHFLKRKYAQGKGKPRKVLNAFRRALESGDSGLSGGHRKGNKGTREAKVNFYKADDLGRYVADGGTKTPDGVSWEVYVFPDMESLEWRDFRVHRTLIDLLYMFYSNAGAALSIDLCCNLFRWPRTVFNEVRARLGLTHTKPAISDESLEEMTYEDIIRDAEKTAESSALLWLMKHQDARSAEEKRELVRLRKEKHDWIIKESEILSALREVGPEVRAASKKVPKPNQSASKDYCHSMNMFDWHVGEGHGDEVSLAEPLNLATLEKRLDNVVAQWLEEARRRPVETCFLNFGGDNLHSLTGKTPRGTDISGSVETWGTDQLLACKKMVKMSIDAGLEAGYKNLIVNCIRGGNHDADEKKRLYWVYTILELIKDQFPKDRVKFVTSKAATLLHQFGNNDMLLDHGYNLPDPNKKGEKAKKPQDAMIPAERLVNIFGLDPRKRRVTIIRGHLHKQFFSEHSICNEVCCGSLVGTNLHAESGFYATSDPSQTLLTFHKEKGLKDITFLEA